MKITRDSFSNYSLSFFKENLLTAFKAQHEKILKVVVLALLSLVACYVVRRCIKAKSLSDKKDLLNGKEMNKPDGNDAKDPQEKSVIRQVIIYPDGTRADGEIKDGKLDGKGKMTYRGKEEEGEFVAGILHGNGKITYKNGRIDAGEFKGGLLNGPGKITFCVGRINEGEFKDNFLHGHGKMICRLGIDEGEFVNGIMYKGKITFHNPNGKVLQGEFNENGRLHGNGEATYSNGLIEKGKFDNGKLNGEGKITYPDGKVEEGIFENGVLIQPKK